MFSVSLVGPRFWLKLGKAMQRFIKCHIIFYSIPPKIIGHFGKTFGTNNIYITGFCPHDCMQALKCNTWR